MNKLKLLGLIIAMIFSNAVFAQEEEGEIVMTESELTSFLETVADARREQLKLRKEKKAKTELAELRYKYNDQMDPRARSYREPSNYEILRELDRLNARLDYMNNRTSEMPSSGQGSSSTIVVPGSSNSTGYIPYNQGQQTFVPDNKPDNKRELEMTKSIMKLERKLDSLTALQSNVQPAKPDEENREIADLKNQFQSLEERLANTENPVERRSLLEELLEKFKNFKKQVFFANNSDRLGPNDLAYIRDVADVLKQYPELSIVLEGWASTKGNIDYNKQLSMRRSESVEQALLNNGIYPNRIVSSFRGEDTSTSEAMARRVDMSIILK